MQVNECLDLLVREARKKDNRLERRTVIVRWQDRVQVVLWFAYLYCASTFNLEHAPPASGLVHRVGA